MGIVGHAHARIGSGIERSDSVGVEEGAEVVLFERERPAESTKLKAQKWEWVWKWDGEGGCVGDSE